MRYSKMLIPTVKETPADAQVTSHRLMIRSGMIRKVAAGIYTYLPLGWRVFQKVARIVREEMDRAGAQELHMPAVQPAELWESSGRWQQYGPELLRFQDRKGADFCFGPTHEEVITSLVRDEVKSYKQLPLNLYQVQTKFRDEIRPRFGLMRGREFIMKDAYSFDVDEAGANASYDAMYAAYNRIFSRMGLEFRPVEADTGAIGGNRSHEFQVIAETGEDAIVVCEECGYAANVELAKIKTIPNTGTPGSAAEKVSTPGKKTIAAVADFLGVEPKSVIKSVAMLVDDEPVLALCRGDHEVNETKLKKAVGGTAARMLEDKEIWQLLGAKAGYMGPIGIKDGVRVVADHALTGAVDMVTGANETGFHWSHAAEGRDFKAEPADLRTAMAGDPCGNCETPLTASRGIEVGHVFFLGDKYSVAMGATVQDEGGSEIPLIMGCYGIGVTRTAAAAIEQNHDDDGIRWPAPIAPYHVSLLALGKDEEVATAADALYAELTAAGIEVLYDDRDARPGAKFKDADLIGCPVRVSVGKKGLDKGEIEIKRRDHTRDQTELVPPADAAARTAAIIHGLLEESAQ